MFHEFVTVGRGNRKEETLGILPVGMIQRTGTENFTVECEDRKVINFHTAWQPGRLFAVDMAGFAFKVKALLDTKARFGRWMGNRLFHFAPKSKNPRVESLEPFICT